MGLYPSSCIAVVKAFFGGRPGVISSATGAMAQLLVSSQRALHWRPAFADPRTRGPRPTQLEAGTPLNVAGRLRTGSHSVLAFEVPWLQLIHFKVVEARGVEPLS